MKQIIPHSWTILDLSDAVACNIAHGTQKIVKLNCMF